MTNIAVITALQPRADLPAHPRASLEAGGIMLLERNVRLLRRAGAQVVYILTDDQFAVLAPLVSVLGKAQDIKLIDNAIELTNCLADDDSVMVLDEGVLLDERMIATIASNDAPHIISVFPSRSPEYERAVRIDPEYSFASILKAPGKSVRDVCRGLGDWDFVHTLLRTVAATPDTQMMAVPSLETYVEDRRRNLPMIWQPMKAATDQPAALGLLLEAAQPHVQSWSARFLHQRLENALAGIILPMAVSPTLLSLLGVLMGFLAAGCFVAGWLWAGLLLALAIGPLDGLTDKLEYLRVQYDRLGRAALWLNRLAECLCYAGLAFYFAQKTSNTMTWVIFFLIVMSRTATVATEVFFCRFTGRQLADAGPLERKISLFAAGRTNLFWALVPFAVTDNWLLGYKFIALYAGLSFFWAQFRLFIRLKEYGSLASPAVAANFERASDTSLRPRKTGTR
jgi:1L-myo-inositol 1-phosphate cytidylyltransferase / CDP-L-myo-inositol myo-inositolphosphotransferase